MLLQIGRISLNADHHPAVLCTLLCCLPFAGIPYLRVPALLSALDESYPSDEWAASRADFLPAVWLSLSLLSLGGASLLQAADAPPLSYVVSGFFANIIGWLLHGTSSFAVLRFLGICFTCCGGPAVYVGCSLMVSRLEVGLLKTVWVLSSYACMAAASCFAPSRTFAKMAAFANVIGCVLVCILSLPTMPAYRPLDQLPPAETELQTIPEDQGWFSFDWLQAKLERDTTQADWLFAFCTNDGEIKMPSLETSRGLLLVSVWSLALINVCMYYLDQMRFVWSMYQPYHTTNLTILLLLQLPIGNAMSRLLLFSSTRGSASLHGRELFLSWTISMTCALATRFAR